MQTNINGTKYDQEKPRMDLLDFDALEGLAKVLTMGANKYGPDNWRMGINNSRLVASLLRHLAAYQGGEDTDPESGLSHIDHIGANWLFLSANAKQSPHLDDRWSRRNTSSGATTTSTGIQSTQPIPNVAWSHLIEQLDATSARELLHA